MFILTEDTQELGGVVGHEELRYAGEAEELASAGVELAEAFSMMQIGFARLEARAIREEAGEGVLSEDTVMLLDEAAKDFFKKALDAIKKYWGKLISFIKSAVERVRNFLTGQERFIRTNREKLAKLTDADLKEVKFNRSYVVADPKVLNAVASGADSYAKELLAKVETGNAAKMKVETFQKGAVSAMKITGEAAKADSLSAAIKEAVNGTKDKDASMTTKDVTNAITILEEAKSVQGVLKEAQTAANSAIKVAESRAKMGMAVNTKGEEKTKKEEITKTLNNVKALSPRIGSLFSASVSATAGAASNAKSTLSKALAAKAGEAKQEDGVQGVLDRFMY